MEVPEAVDHTVNSRVAARHSMLGLAAESHSERTIISDSVVSSYHSS